MFLMGQTTDEYYYYYNGKRIPLELNRDYVSISSKKVEVSNLPNNVSVQGRPALSEEGNYLREIRIGENITEKTYMDRISLLEKDRDIISILPYFKTKNNDKIGVSNYFFVKLKKDSDEDLLYSFAKSHKCIVVNKNKFMPLWYTLSTTKESFYTSLKIANIFYESNYFEEAEPDLMLDNLILGDNTFENTQWGLDNTGQYGKQKGIDIKAKQAWRISRGKDVKVAVLDQGIELNHPDLKENLSSLSYDTEKGVSPSVLLGEHGTACAGIIGAVDNEIGIIGVAPESKLISISNILRMTLKIKEKLADGINWAWQNGADVISNSWGGEDLRSMFIDDAIKNALTKGRNGKGCVVVFATGNSNNKVLYPANSNPDIIAVGAMSPCGERKNPSSCDKEDWWGSCYGNELDVMAPGVLISTTDISTIDYEGREGYNPHSPLNPPIIPDFDNTDYTNSFGGTSSACPHVAGVAALILSVNPDLTAKQVADIIEQTAQKVGGYNYQNTYTRPNGTWNNEMGYGLVDAYKALQKATIAGPDEFCLKTDATFELIAPIPNDATIKWEDPEYKLEIVSGQGTKSCVFRGTYWDGNRTIKAVVTYKDGTVKSFEKEVYVRYQGNWANAQYTIKNHPQSPYSTPCCNGSTRVIKHVILDDYMGGASIKVEWKNTIVYKDPKDNFEFRGTNREEEFVATRYTFTPFIVETKMRYISDCGTPTKWSNTIARYYGAINETSFRSASAYNSPVKSTNEDIPVYEFFTNRASTLRVQTEDLQQWLDAKYSGKELNDKELQKVLYYLNNRDNLDKIGVKVFDFSGKRILQGDLDFGKSLDFNMSRYAKGFYIIIYEFGSISNGKVIYKP
jgi:alkaline serine protease